MSYHLPRIVGTSVAADWMLTGRTVTADEADRRGLVSELVEPDRLVGRAIEIASAIAELAPLGVQLTKAKVAGAVKTGYLRLERSRQLYQLARRMLSAGRVVEASYQPDRQDLDPARAQLEAELLRADLEYRQAYAQVKNLIAGQATGSAPYGEGISAVRE